LGTEPELVTAYVESGKVRLVFWPVLNHGDPSVYATLAAECVAQQDMEAFWEIHHQLFQRQEELWRADRDYFINAATQVGADATTFAACYDGGAALDHVLALDALRRERGIFNQPVFDVNGALLYGTQPFTTFAQLVESSLP
jgi:protein-disulfide isomerase